MNAAQTLDAATPPCVGHGMPCPYRVAVLLWATLAAIPRPALSNSQDQARFQWSDAPHRMTGSLSSARPGGIWSKEALPKCL
jgi:hypothetical protein